MGLTFIISPKVKIAKFMIEKKNCGQIKIMFRLDF